MMMLNYANGKCGLGASPSGAIFQDRGMERASTDVDEKTSTYCGSYDLRSRNTYGTLTLAANKQVAQMKRHKPVSCPHANA